MIPDAAVEAAAATLPKDLGWSDYYLKIVARAALDAAAPHMLPDAAGDSA